MSRRTVVGLISDTHGLLRQEALDLLGDSDFIVHGRPTPRAGGWQPCCR